MELQHIKSLQYSFTGDIQIGDPSLITLLENSSSEASKIQLSQQIYQESFNAELNAWLDIYRTADAIHLVIQLFNQKQEKPALTYLPFANTVTTLGDMNVVHKLLLTNTSNFTIATPYGFSDIDVASNGDFGEVWSATDAAVIVLRFTHKHTTTDAVVNIAHWLFSSEVSDVLSNDSLRN